MLQELKSYYWHFFLFHYFSLMSLCSFHILIIGLRKWVINQTSNKKKMEDSRRCLCSKPLQGTKRRYESDKTSVKCIIRMIFKYGSVWSCPRGWVQQYLVSCCSSVSVCLQWAQAPAALSVVRQLRAAVRASALGMAGTPRTPATWVSDGDSLACWVHVVVAACPCLVSAPSCVAPAAELVLHCDPGGDCLQHCSWDTRKDTFWSKSNK